MRASHRHSVSVRPGPAPYPGGSADRPGRRGPSAAPRGRRGHMGPGRDGRRGARSGAAVRVVDLGGRRRLHPRRGMGPLGRRHGFAADHVHRLRLVTADGRPHKIDADRAPELFWRCAVPARASASSPSWSSRCSRSPACTGAGCSCPAPPPRSCCTCGAMGTYAARRGRHVGGAAAAAPPPVAPPGAARARGGPPALHPRRAPRRGRGAARPAARGRHATARRRPRAARHRRRRRAPPFPAPDARRRGRRGAARAARPAVAPCSPRRARTCPRRWTWWSCGRWVARWSVRRRCATSSPDAARRGRCGCGARWCRGVLAFPVSPGAPVTATSPTRSAVPAAATRVIGALVPWSLGGALPNFAGAEPPGALWSRVDRARLRCSRPSTRTACSPGPRCPDWPDSLHGRRAGTVGARVVRAVASPAGAGRPAAAARPARSHRCRAPRPSARCR